jgi:hypothetical protein
MRLWSIIRNLYIYTRREILKEWAPLYDIGELLDKLVIVNKKLYEVCNKKADMVKDPSLYTKMDAINLLANDLELCKTRAALKNQIKQTIDDGIRNGHLDKLNEVKAYG